jgi:hypothetical protein
LNLLEAKQALARKLDIDYSNIALNGLFTDSDLSGLIQFGLQRAWDYKPWPFKVVVKTTITGVNIDYYDYPTDMMNGSGYLLIVGGKEYKKLTIEDYLSWLQRNPTDNTRYWSENGTFVFINKNAYSQGVDNFDIYGRGMAPTLVNPTDLLPFSPTTDNEQYSGNEAIVQLAYSEALDSEKKRNPQAAEVERKKAYESLGLLWKPFAEMKANLQPQRSMFQTPNFFPGYIGRNSGDNPIGNFPERYWF